MVLWSWRPYTSSRQTALVNILVVAAHHQECSAGILDRPSPATTKMVNYFVPAFVTSMWNGNPVLDWFPTQENPLASALETLILKTFHLYMCTCHTYYRESIHARFSCTRHELLTGESLRWPKSSVLENIAGQHKTSHVTNTKNKLKMPVIYKKERKGRLPRTRIWHMCMIRLLGFPLSGMEVTQEYESHSSMQDFKINNFPSSERFLVQKNERKRRFSDCLPAW